MYQENGGAVKFGTFPKGPGCTPHPALPTDKKNETSGIPNAPLINANIDNQIRAWSRSPPAIATEVKSKSHDPNNPERPAPSNKTIKPKGVFIW